MDLGLKGKTIFITGGSSGIGKYSALIFAKEEGARIAFTYHKGKIAAQEIVREIQVLACEAIAVYMALDDHSSIKKAVDTVTHEFGTIHVLVNNAVYWGDPKARGRKFEEMPIEQWQNIIGTNLFGTVHLTQLVVPFMKKQLFGRIINISSDIAVESMTGSGPYGTLKAALFGLTSNLVTELSRYNILSNVILPSLVLTDRAIQLFPQQFQEKAKEAFPSGRITTPEDVATLIAYLGSAANGHVNGEFIKVTGKGSQSMLNSISQEYLS